MPAIRQLPPGLVNLIAAGEVVERPAAVAKELIENALDAGATRITVTVEEGGVTLLRVADDGHGIPAAELPLALHSHATSKITDAADLDGIASFGFRGEALASIGAVALVRISSATADGAGAEILDEAGTIHAVQTVARPKGTTVEVRELFAATPARRKFLRSARAEFAHVAEVVERTALAHPEVEFELTHNGREVLRAPRTDDRYERAAAILGADVMAGWAAVDFDDGAGCAVFGWVAPADRAAGGSRARALRLFVNERPVRDRGLSHAVQQGYREKLPVNRYPTALLFVTVPPESVDVNVHPAKTEVRFREPRRVHDLVAAAVDRALGHERTWGTAAPAAAPAASAAPAAPAPRAPRAADRVADASAGLLQPQVLELFRAEAPTDVAPGAATGPPALTPLGAAYQLCDTYIVEECAEGIVLTDQHALHERLLLDELLAAWDGNAVPRQALLLPVPLPADRVLAAVAADHADDLLALGVELELHPGDVVLVRAVPPALGDRDPVRYVQAVLADIAEGYGDHAALEPRRRLAATIACHSAVTAGHRLTEAELRDLLARRGPPAPGWHCAHGRPAVILLPHDELRRRFCRHVPKAGGPG
ncbi:MAG: DNA mismatch repair endonuclease MutL [Planctomycetota bacterium]